MKTAEMQHFIETFFIPIYECVCVCVHAHTCVQENLYDILLSL